MLPPRHDTYEYRRYPTNCFTINNDGSLEEGVILGHYGEVIAEKELSQNAQLLMADIIQCNEQFSFVVKSPENMPAMRYHIVEVPVGLSFDEARKFKRGDSRHWVTHGVTGTAETLILKKQKALIRIYDGQTCIVLRPNGYVLKFSRESASLKRHSLTPYDMVAVRLDHAATALKNTEKFSKREGVHNEVLKLLCLQTDPEIVRLICTFMYQQEVSKKIEMRMRAIMVHNALEVELSSDTTSKLRVVKKVRKNTPVQATHRQKFSTHRSSQRA